MDTTAPVFIGNCEYCNKAIWTAKPIRNKNQKHCSSGCYQDHYAGKIYGEEAVTIKHVSTGMTGAWGELVVSADLIAKGIYPFRALSPSCPCDLVALHDGRLYRIEVRCGTRNMSGGINYTKSDSSRYDILAVVFRDQTIAYLPDVFGQTLEDAA